MNKHKQLHFIAIILSTFALSPALVPVCHAQLGDTNGSDVAGDSGSDEVDTDTETGGSGSDTVDAGSDEDTGSGEAGTGSPAVATELGSIGVMIFQAAGPNPAPPDTDSKHGRCVSRCSRGAKQWQCGGPIGVGPSRDQLGRRR